jgi:hypothetical protein
MAAAQVDALIGSGAFDAVASTLDALELEHGVDEHWPWAAHLLGHLANGDLELARVCYERAPESARRDQATNAAFDMVRCALERDFPGVHTAAKSAAWSTPSGESLVPLVKRVTDSQKERALALMHRAYTTITVSAAARNLGASETDATRELVNTHAWTLDVTTQILKVTPPKPSPRQHSAMEALGRLTEYVVAMDSGPSAA